MLGTCNSSQVRLDKEFILKQAGETVRLVTIRQAAENAATEAKFQAMLVRHRMGINKRRWIWNCLRWMLRMMPLQPVSIQPTPEEVKAYIDEIRSSISLSASLKLNYPSDTWEKDKRVAKRLIEMAEASIDGTVLVSDDDFARCLC